MAQNQLAELQAKINDYLAKGCYTDVVAACREARYKTRAWLERQLPQTGFGGRSLITDESNSRTNHQLILGSFDINAQSVRSVTYANHFLRWYATGAYGRIIRSGKRKGQKGPSYPSRGALFSATKIEEYYAAEMDKILDQKIKKVM